MIVRLSEPATFPVFGMRVCKDALRLRSMFAIQTMNVAFGKRDRWLKPGDLRKHTDKGDHTFWEYRFKDPPF